MSKFDYSKGIVYLRNSFIPFSDANLSIASSPVLYGLSIYTVLSLNFNKNNQKLHAFRLKDHFNRLVNSAKIHSFSSSDAFGCLRCDDARTIRIFDTKIFE